MEEIQALNPVQSHVLHPVAQNLTACLQNPKMGQMRGWKSSRDLLSGMALLSGLPTLWSFTPSRAFSHHGPNPSKWISVKYCSEPYLTLQLTQGAILHPQCRAGCGRSCWDGRCELFGQASPEPASLWERGSHSQAALLPSKAESSISLTATQPGWPAPHQQKIPQLQSPKRKKRATLEPASTGTICNIWICCSRLGNLHSHHPSPELQGSTQAPTAASSRESPQRLHYKRCPESKAFDLNFATEKLPKPICSAAKTTGHHWAAVLPICKHFTYVITVLQTNLPIQTVFKY